jgi:WD40 repeat protein
VRALAITGSDAISVDETGEVRRWTLADGTLLASWKTPTPLYAVAVSPDGARIAIGGDDGIVRILDRALVPRGEHRGHTQRVFALAFSPDGHLLASGSADTSIRLIDDRDGSIRVLSGHTQRVYSVAFSPAGKQLASASDDRTARVWSLDSTGSIVIDGHPRGGVMVAAWFPDGERLFTTGWDGALKIWDTRTGMITVDDPTWPAGGSVHAGAVVADGKLIVTGHSSVRLWDPATRSLVADLDGHAGTVNAVAASPDVRWLVSAGHDGVPRVWDLGAALRLARLGHQRTVRRIAFARDGKTVITSGTDNTIRLWDATSGAELRRLSPRHECNDGATILAGEIGAGCADGNVYLWSGDRTRTRTLAGSGRGVRHAVAAPDGSWIAAGHIGGWIHVWDNATGKLLAQRQVHDHNIYGLHALPDGTLLSTSLDNTVRRTSSTLEPLALWRAPGIEGLLDAAIDPRGRFVVAGGDGSPIFKWDLTLVGAPAVALAGHTSSVSGVDVSPDGALVASASSDGTIRLWDTTTWSSRVLRGPAGGVQDLAFSPDGRWLATGHGRGAAVVWDVATGTPLRRLGASEAGEQGSCDNFDAVAWNDPGEKTLVLWSCLEPSGFARMSARTHLVLENQVDLVEKW